jgi:3',5'-cyclic AMP phosphodiesterase CpdA
VNLWAISDLHVGYAENRHAVEALSPHPGDWLIIGGDTGETPSHLEFVLKTLTPRFAKLIWTPGKSRPVDANQPA